MDLFIILLLNTNIIFYFFCHMCFCIPVMNSFTPAVDDRFLLSYQDGSIINMEGETKLSFEVSLKLYWTSNMLKIKQRS